MPSANGGSNGLASVFAPTRKRRSGDVSASVHSSVAGTAPLEDAMSLMAWEDGQGAPEEQQNEQALKITKRIKEKLNGRDFGDHTAKSAVNVEEQVDKLVDSAQRKEHLAQMFVGWCAFW